MWWNKKNVVVKAEMVKSDKEIELQTKVEVLEREYKDLQNLYDNLILEKDRLFTKLNKTNKKVREQTEADLFFISAKIQKKLLEGKTKESIKPLIYEQRNLERLYAQQQAQSSEQQSVYAQLFGIGMNGNNPFWR
ncbi:MAG: hypothetical protein PHH73_00210 [Candidatus Rickettsiella isopodorum]|nr:hypothetical protein [Candidatus Rickettsiella isopodorum]